MLEDLRAVCADIADQAGSVKIHKDRIEAYAASLPVDPYPDVLSPEYHYEGEDHQSLMYILALEGVNFGSGLKPDLKAENYKLVDGSIYFSVATFLKKQFEEKPLSASDLAGISHRDVARIFALDPACQAQNLLSEMFWRSWTELGKALCLEYEGRPENLLSACEGDVEKFIGRLSELHTFRDYHDYNGRNIPFMKRAQHLAASLHMYEDMQGRQLFNNIDRLTMFADPTLPKVLHVDGILEYDDKLLQTIAEGTAIKSGSLMEIEIRACALAAVELISRLHPLSAMQIDHILWHKSHNEPYAGHPAHKTVTYFY